jgi:SAM-dependent methyltransferase
MLKHHAERWNELAASDPLWAILSDPAARGNRWNLSDFFATGERELAPVFARATEIGLPQNHDSALDFGCGVGRLTRAMASRFTRCVGVDISPIMVGRARELNSDQGACEFVVNSYPDLRGFPNNGFNFIYTSNVLQHLVHRDSIMNYISEFIRILAPRGLAVFQLPTRISPLRSFHWRPNLYEFGRLLRVDPDYLLRWGLHPIRMVSVPEAEVAERVMFAGGEVRLAMSTPVQQVISTVFYVSKRTVNED